MQEKLLFTPYSAGQYVPHQKEPTSHGLIGYNYMYSKISFDGPRHDDTESFNFIFNWNVIRLRKSSFGGVTHRTEVQFLQPRKVVHVTT